MFIKPESDKDQDQNDGDNRESNDGEMWHLSSPGRLSQHTAQSQRDKGCDGPNFNRLLLHRKGQMAAGFKAIFRQREQKIIR
jgi:hypothetical protein